MAEKKDKVTETQKKTTEKAEVKPAPKAETKPAAKPAPKAEVKPAPKAEAKPAAKPAPKAEAKPAAKPAAKKPDTGKDDDKVYHISRRKTDHMWQVKAEGAPRALKKFFTQDEAVEYAKSVANNNEGRIVIHKVDGSFKKLKY